MATKTNDFTATLSSDYSTKNPISVDKKTALIVSDILEKDDVSNLKFSIVKEGNSSYLLVTNSYATKGIKLSNYSSIKYIKTDISGKNYELTDIIANSLVDNTENVISTYDTKKLTVTGTNYNDKIDMSLPDYAPTGAANIKNNKGLTINSSSGNDEITGTKYNDTINAGDGNDIIHGSAGNDIITGGKGDNKFYYTGGNDTYKFTKISGMTSIVDGGGSNDKLVMSKANAKNVVYLADFTTDNKINSTKLFIFDKTSEGIIEIKDYFNVSESAITGTDGSGKIESIKAGKTEFVSKIDNFYTTSTNYSQLASDVASWLSTNTGCTNIGDLVNDGSQSQIQDFIAYFSNK